MHSLPIFLKLAGEPVVLIGEGDAADAKRRLLERAGARVVAEDAAARLAIVALSDDAAAKAVVTRLRARGMLVNATDRPELCDFTLPAIVDRDPVLVAVGTGGASAGLAKAVRQRIETALPAGIGALAMALAAAKAQMRLRWPDADDRRRALDAGLAPGGHLDLDHEPDVAAWLSAHGDAQPARLVAVALASDDPDDLTLGTARLLGQADRVYHQPGVAGAILNRARADAARIEADAPPDAPPPGLSLFLKKPA